MTRNILETKKIGALLRCYARTSDLVPRAVELTMASVARMRSVRFGDRPFVSRILILVPTDSSYVECDCGETIGALRQAIRDSSYRDVFVENVTHGDLFVGVLNHGVAKLLRDGCDFGLILSKEAEEYFTQETCEDILSALNAGAKVAGVAINELSSSIMNGRIANTFAVWDLMALVGVSCFDQRNAKQRKDAPFVTRAQTWDKDKKFWHYDLAGVEEIIPLVHLVRRYGACLAPILPRGEGVKRWQTPSPQTDLEGYLRQMNKVGTKYERQAYFAALIQATLAVLMGGVMQQYRHPEYFDREVSA